MPNRIRAATHWVGRHAFPVVVAAVIAVGGAGAGIGYALASHSTTAPVSSAPPSSTPSAPAGKRAKGAGRGGQLLQQALSLLATQTGQTVASVHTQLDAGKSIDDIAGAKAPAIEADILAQVNKLAARAVSAGKITAAQEATLLAMAKTKVEALMAEPGTHLIKDAQQFAQSLQGRAAKHKAAATPAPTTAA